jgi:hypothetical protein
MFQFMFFSDRLHAEWCCLFPTVGGFSNFGAAPQGFFNPLAVEYGWCFSSSIRSRKLLATTILVMRNDISAPTLSNRQKNRRSLYDSLHHRQCHFYLPPLIARVALPELGTVANG